MYIPSSIQQTLQKYSSGEYVIHPAYKDNTWLIAWIEQAHYKEYESPKYQMQQHARQRNFLYCFTLENINKEVILKVSDHSKYKKWYRRLNQWLVSLFKDYSLNAYFGSIGLAKNNIDSIRVIAYWTHKTNKKKSYLLYEAVEAEITAHELCEQIQRDHQDAENIIYAITQRLANIVRSMHVGNIRHGDPHAGNFLLTTPIKDITELTVSSVSSLDFTLIDLDKTHFSRLTKGNFKHIGDLRDLRRFRVHHIEGVACLPFYLEEEPSTMQKMILMFWMRGGFNIYKWFKRSNKRK